MNYIEVYPMEILQGMSSGDSYILMLMEPRSGKSVPVIIGDAEAQHIIMAQEGLQGQRPTTHELMQHMMDAYALTLKSVSIERFVEGVFYARLHMSDGFYEKAIDSRTSDAVALALRYKCSILMNEAVLQEASVDSGLLDSALGSGEWETAATNGRESREELERMLRECEQNEAFELAEEIAKRLKQLDKDDQ